MTVTTGSFTTSDDVELHTRSWLIDNPRYDVLLVHGLGEHCGRWDAQATHFNRHGANVYSYDLRGHGQSGGDRGDVEEFANYYRDISEVAAATVATTGRPWVLYGHSFGGLQCSGYLIRDYEPHPNIAVLSSPWMLSTRSIDPFLKQGARLAVRVVPTMSIPASIQGHQLSRDPAVGEEYFADPHVGTTATVRFGAEATKEQDALVDGWDSITIPAFVIHGADDELVAPRASAGLAASPGVQRKVYPGLRHETHNEPEGAQVLGDITDWIEAKLF